MEYEDKKKIAAESSQALLKHLSESAVTVFNTADSIDPEDWDIFSGTLIQIDARLFACTASHCVDQGSSLSRYWIVDGQRRYSGEGMPQVIAAYGCANDKPDVGILELDRGSFAKHSTKIPCALDRLAISGTGR